MTRTAKGGDCGRDVFAARTTDSADAMESPSGRYAAASPSGMPGVQTLVPVMLDHVNKGHLTLERFVDLTSTGPARVYGISGKGRIAVGYDADLTIVDLKMSQRIDKEWLASRCGWSPFEGMKVTGWPRLTVLRGRVVMREGHVRSPIGRSVRFCETL